MGMAIFLLLLIAAYTAIAIWVFGRKRKARFAKYSRIPLDEESREPPGLAALRARLAAVLLICPRGHMGQMLTSADE